MVDLLTHRLAAPKAFLRGRGRAFITRVTSTGAVVGAVVLVLILTNRVSSPGLSSGASSEIPPALLAETQHVDWSANYTWLSKKERKAYEALVTRILTPPGYERVALPEGSFGEWLRYLPVMPAGSPVKSAGGKVILAGDHPNLAAVVTLQPRAKKVLSAANILIRLRAEYDWSLDRGANATFHFTSGQKYSWASWTQGVRTRLDGRKVAFYNTDHRRADRAEYCQYLETVFRYSSLISLMDDTRCVEDGAIGVGDIFLRQKRPGHALMVLDAATDAEGRVRILLGEGGSPAQTFHVLQSDAGNPWFPFTRETNIDLAGKGVFGLEHLRRWVR